MWTSVLIRRLPVFLLLALLALPGFGLGSVAAQDLAQPGGPVILTISGAIQRGNSRDAQGNIVANFDLKMLEALGETGFSTTTPWHKGTVRFDGVPGKALMETVGAKPDGIVQAVALNDYASSVPVADFLQRGLIVALKLDGAYMTIRDKGPLFIIYPFDSQSELRHETYYTRSVWQLRRLDIR